MLSFAQVALLRLARDRTNLFFVLIFPLLLVLLIGVQFSGGTASSIAFVEGEDVVAAAIAGTPGVTAEAVRDADAVERAVAGGSVSAGIVSTSSGVEWVHRAGDAAPGLRARVQITLDVADVDAQIAGALGTLAIDAVAAPVDVRSVDTRAVGEPGLEAEFAGLGRFDLGASSQLLLFVFITSLTGSAVVIQVRRWGVLDRVLAGPTTPAVLLGGIALGQLAVALTQALLIVVGTALLFDVAWGDPIATTAVVVAFSVVATAAGLLLGALLRTDEQAGGLGVPLALGMAALGGSMVPLELFPDGLATAARITPHAWGNLAFAEIVRRGGGVGDVLPELAALLGFAVVFGLGALVGMRRRLGLG